MPQRSTIPPVIMRDRIEPRNLRQLVAHETTEHPGTIVIDTLFRIHGTSEPYTIGKSVSSGCIRMFNQDVIDLYRRVPSGAWLSRRRA